ncbi:hypothetical protein PUN4_230136 [Paraburkholderia unamae]|uniref:DUF4214 domain-containing protein n=1 Tax=Paraburkholderia unamae TaxID=219649 RepID=UPI001CAABE49|nr:DUF4214 domain-containing protein [Paraburkholderia unamae]CAG9255233.1 hypothetical protein PUN4_230136 [Paraburkholderia unamae]
MMTSTSTLNADGSLSFYEYGPDGTLLYTNWSADVVKNEEAGLASWVLNNSQAGATVSPDQVVIGNLAVQNGLITQQQLVTWATSNNIQVDNIFTGTPTSGGATVSESYATAVNDPLVTSNGGAPTLAEAAAQAASNSQASHPSPTGPSDIAGLSPAVQEVQAAYVAYYGRPADAGGLDYWTAQLQATGGNLDSIIGAFGNSAESQSLYNGQSVSQIVSSIYQHEFNRTPDDAGLAYWENQISTGATSAAAAALAIFNGASGSDQTIVNNKMVVAVATTNALASDSLATGYYSGDAAAANARMFLASVDSSSANAVKMAGIAHQVTQDIQNVDSVTNDLAGIGVTIVGQPTTTLAQAHALA